MRSRITGNSICGDLAWDLGAGICFTHVMSKDVSVKRGVNSAICTLVHCASTRVELEHVCDFVTRGREGCGIHCDIAVILGPRGQTEKGIQTPTKSYALKYAAAASRLAEVPTLATHLAMMAGAAVL